MKRPKLVPTRNPQAFSVAAPSDPPSTPAPLFAQGIAAARANLIPGIVLWVVAVSIVTAYYFAPAAESFFQEVARLKSKHGYLFSGTSTAIFGGLIPFILAVATRRNLAPRWEEAVFALLFWGFKGLEFDTLYRVQTHLFGDSTAPSTVAVKVLVDQLVYCPVWGVPSMVFLYLWKDSGFDFTATRRRLGPRWYRNRVAPLLISNWAIWIPGVTCIYLLPAPLQLPLQNIVLCFWVLMVMFMTSPAPPAPDQ